jgi:hypothetical protein
MPVVDEQDRPRYRTFCAAGALGGGLFGIISGPISMIACMSLEHYLHGTTFLGLELVGAPILGSVVGALQGAGVGAIWAYMVKRRRRLTIAGLMLVAAISGPSLALILADPPLALLVLLNAALVLPVAIMIMMAVGQRQEERRQSGRQAPRRSSSGQHEGGIDGLSVRSTDW